MDSFQPKFTKRTTKYVVNGQEYRSLDEVPEQFRAMFEDRDGDGCPDWVHDKMASAAGDVSSLSIEHRTVNGVTTYKVGDREYQSLDQMPADERALFERFGRGVQPDRFPRRFGGPVLDAASRALPDRGFPAPERPIGGRNPAELMPGRAPLDREAVARGQHAGRGNRLDAVSVLFFAGAALLAAVVLAACWALLR